MLNLMIRKTCFSFFIFITITLVVFLALLDLNQNTFLKERDKNNKGERDENNHQNNLYLKDPSNTDLSSQNDLEPKGVRIDENRKQTDDYEFNDDDNDHDNNDDEDDDEEEEEKNYEFDDDDDDDNDNDVEDGDEEKEKEDYEFHDNDDDDKDEDEENKNSDGESRAQIGSDATPNATFQKPEGEKFMERRFPQAVIIGFPKCGTRALLEFIGYHPYVVVTHTEMHFYDQHFSKGYQWYLEQMPYSWSNQVTMEKTPAYVRTPRARIELKQKFPNIKLIVLVRDPVKRVVSQDAQNSAKGINVTPDTPLSEAFMDRTGRAIDNDKGNVVQSRFYEVLLPWYNDFPREQILVINGDEFIKAPLGIMKRVEEFLNIPKFFNEQNLYYVKDRGFFCVKDFEKNKLRCMGKTKGIKHKQLLKEHETMLYNYYRPYNEKLYKLINQTFDWDKPSS